MKVAVQMSAAEELKAIQIILRDRPGMVLRGPIYILEESTTRLLRNAGITFTILCRESSLPPFDGPVNGRIL